MSPKASVIVPSHGGARRLPRLLECLQNQSESDFEIIVVLDEDIDGSSSVVGEYANSDNRIKVIIFDVNRGRTAALNAGFEAARGRVYIRCDDDLAPAPDYIRRHLSHHVANEVGVIGIYRNVLPDTPYARSYGRHADENFRQMADLVTSGDEWKFWAGNVSVTAETYKKVGPYDSDYRAYGWEDVDWGYRLKQSGARIIIDPSLATDHHVAATTTQIRVRRAFQSAVARHVFDRKHPEAHANGVQPDGVWGFAVRGTGRLSLHWLNRFAQCVDVLLPYVPPPVGRKFVAVLVEGALEAGKRSPGQNDMGI